MATTISGTSITFNDGSVQSANAIIATAAALHGQLGTYAFLNYPSNTTDRAPGFTVAGSSLVYSSSADGLGSAQGATAPPGSWRLMGNLLTVVSGKSTFYNRTSVWLRYA